MTQGSEFIIFLFVFLCICIGICAAARDKKPTSSSYKPISVPTYRPPYIPYQNPLPSSYQPRSNLRLIIPTYSHDTFCINCGRLIRAGKRCDCR